MESACILPLYIAFGLRIRSEIAFPELRSEDGTEAGQADVAISEGQLSELWEQHGPSDNYYAYTGGRFLMQVPGTAIFCIQDGNQIIVSPHAGADETSIRLYVLGTCMSVLLMQRGVVPLHGSAVVINGKAYAFIGDSGAGKSTLAAAFAERGYALLTDDVIAVSASPQEGAPVVMPAYPQQKLWEETIALLGMDQSRYNPLYLSKYAIPLTSGFCAKPVPLAGAFELVKSDAENIEIRKMPQLERLITVQYHTFRQFLIPLLGLQQWHFTASAHIAGAIDLYQLRRPSAGFTVHELVSRIVHAVNEGAVIHS